MPIPAIPVTVARFASRKDLAVERLATGEYIVRDEGVVVEMTRTDRPKVCHALAMMRRRLSYLAHTTRAIDSTLPEPTPAQRAAMRGPFAAI